MSCSSIQNRISFKGLEFGTYKFTWDGRQIPHIGRYGGLIGITLGCARRSSPYRSTSECLIENLSYTMNNAKDTRFILVRATVVV